MEIMEKRICKKCGQKFEIEKEYPREECMDCTMKGASAVNQDLQNKF